MAERVPPGGSPTGGQVPPESPRLVRTLLRIVDREFERSDSESAEADGLAPRSDGGEMSRGHRVTSAPADERQGLSQVRRIPLLVRAVGRAASSGVQVLPPPSDFGQRTTDMATHTGARTTVLRLARGHRRQRAAFLSARNPISVNAPTNRSSFKNCNTAGMSSSSRTRSPD